MSISSVAFGYTQTGHSGPIQQILDLFRRDAIRQHLIDLLRPDAVVSGHGFQIVDVVILGIVGRLPDLRDHIAPPGPVAVAHEDVGVIELAAAHAALGIDLQDLAAVHLDLGWLAQLHGNLLQRGLEDRLGAGVDVDAELLEVVNADGVIALDEVQIVLVGHDRDGEGTLQFLRHACQGRKRKLLGCFEELYGDVRVRLDLRGGQTINNPHSSWQHGGV